MKKLKLFFACLLMAVLSIGQVWADDAAVGATLWAENFGHFTTTTTPSAAGTGSGTTIFGGATITYAQSSANTKGYNETLAGGTAPELLLAKSNTTWTISGIPTGGATEMALSFKSNKTTFAVTTSTADLSISGSAKAWTITVDEGKDTPATFDLVIKNTGSSNARIDDVALTVVTAAEGGGTPIPTLSVSPAVIDFGTVEQNAVVANKTVTVSFENLTGSVAYSGLSGAFTATGTISDTGDEITIAANTATAGDYSQTLTVQSAADELSKTVTVKMKVVAPLTPIAGGVVDELIVSDFGVTSGSYTAFTDKQASNEGHSDAVYAGKVARNGNSTQYNIQMNTIGTSTAAGREIATSTSGGYAKRVQAIWATQSTNTANRKLTVYGSESAYTGSETVATGTNLGDLTYTAGDAYAYLDIDGDYPYIQIVASGAIYMDQINVTWVSSAAAVAKPAISGTENFLTSTEVSITCATEGATIYYTTNGSDPKESGSVYSGSFSLTESAHVQAIAKLGSDWSSYADKNFTKITPITVAEAIAAIPNKDDVVNDQYVSGIVCTEAPSLLSGGKLTYYISDDGSETNRLQIYKGKNLNNTDFAAVSDLAIGDRVVVFGQLKNYNGTPEMNDGNYLVSKAAPAVAAPTFSPDGGGFMGETDVTISCATASSAIYYTLDGSAPSKLSTLYEGAIHLTATTTIKAVAFVGDDASLVISRTFTLSEPMTVAEALAALDSEDPINNVAVAGIISTAPTSNPSSGKLTYFISDDGSASDELEVYKGFGIGGASFSDKTDLQVGDEVTVFGNLTIYNTTKEFAEGSRLIAFNRPQVDVESISLTESTAEVEEGKTVTLHASVVPANATNKTIVWSVQSGDTYASVDQNGVVTGIAAGEAVIRAASDEDATIFAECTVTVTEPAPLSPWASVYTSNVTLSTEGGTSASAAKVKFYGEEGDGYDAIKAGTGSAQGVVVVNVPAGATALHFHAYGWNSESVGLTVTAPTGVTVSPATEISINSNSGIASNSPFTLAEGSDPKTDAYYAVSLSGNTEPVALTISATAGKRFVLFGVNQEGGLVLESIAVSGTASVLEYNDGDHFDPTGLVVTGHYSDDSEATISEGIDWTFDPDPLTEGTTSVSVTATVSEITSAAFPVNGLTVNGAAPLSPWASVYTSNVTLSTEGGTSASAAKVKFYGEEGDGYDAIKAGTGSAQGVVVVNVPAGATALHFHAYGWNSESVGLTVTAPTGVTVSPATEISINSNSGIASNSPFTLAEGSDPKTDAYYAVSLSGNTEATNITISATSGKRFVLFGVNQEGGVLPELQSIAISGDLDNKSYKAGQALDMTGLTVTATYTLGGTPQTPVDITNDPGLAWTYDPLVENQDEVTVTAHFGDPEKTASKTIEGLTVTSADPKIYVEPSLTVNFGSVEVGEAVPANKTITVTLTNVAAATATLGGTNPEAFSIDKTALVDGDVITISVIASTAAAASYSATITITDDAAAATEKVVNLSFAVTEPAVEETPVSPTSEWVVAATVADGMEVLLTGVKSETTYALSAQGNNNRTADAGMLSEGVFTPGNNTMSVTLEQQSEGKFALRTSNGKYLYAASSSANNLKTRDAIGDDGKAVWTISINGDNEASIVANCETTNWRNVMQFNQNGSNAPVFNCYASATQSVIKIYVPKPVTPPTPVYETVRTGLIAGNYYTICYPKAMTDVQGATLWSFVGKDTEFAYIEQETATTIEAGKPYIMYATASTVTAVLGDETNAPGANGAIHGTFSDLTQDQLNTYATVAGNDLYLVIGNELRRATGEGTGSNTLPANRAFVVLGDIPAAPAHMPAHVRRMPMQTDQAQGFENIEASEKPMKLMIDGQMYILRGEKVYDATGRLVK